MAASATDLLKKYKSLFSTTLSTGIGTGTGDTLTPATVTGLPTDTGITLTLDRVDSAGVSLGTQVERITGVVSGGNLASYVRAKDNTTEQAHSGGAVIEMVWNAQDWNDMVDWGLVSHTQAGYLKANSVTASMITASNVTASKIAASAVLAGNLNASSVLSGNLAASSVLLGNLAASSVSAGNLNFAVSSSTDGWTTDSGATWTYASATTINVADGTLFQKGDRIKLTQTTAKYFIVVGVSGNVITVTGGTDYTVANAAITTQQYSHQANPLGFPTSFAYTATWSCSGSMTISVGTVNFTRFSVVGNRCTWTFSYSAFTLGGTQSTEIYATLPINSSRSVSGFANDMNCCYQVDGGTSKIGQVGIKDTTPGTARFRNTVEGNWTLGTTNSYLAGQLTYEF